MPNPEPENAYEGLTEDELADIAKESEQQSHEDHNCWAARAAKIAADAKALAKSRREAAASAPAEPAEGAGIDAEASGEGQA